MTILLSRDSVCMGDDVEDHDRQLTVPEHSTLHEIVKKIIEIRYLPGVAADVVTWSVSSKEPLAIISQDVGEPRLLTRMPDLVLSRNRDGNTLKLHCSYIGHIQADVVAGVLERFSLPR